MAATITTVRLGEGVVAHLLVALVVGLSEGAAAQNADICGETVTGDVGVGVIFVEGK